MFPKKNKAVSILVINNVENAKKAFLKQWFIPRRWVNFRNLKEDGSDVKDFFDYVGWTIFLEKFSTLHYCPYALFWGTKRPDKVSIRGCGNREEVIIFSKSITATSDCFKEALVFDKDWEDITYETVDIMLYERPRPKSVDKKTMLSFLRIECNIKFIFKYILFVIKQL